jgi:hypothetical protein
VNGAERPASDGKPSTLSEQVQELLAQGGCPGWITLASDAELQAKLNGAPAVYEGPLRETATRERTPAPIRVAALMSSNDDRLFGSPPTPRAPALPSTNKMSVALLPLPPVDGDELISEGEDLIRSSPAIRGSAAAASEQVAPLSSPTAAPVESEPVAQPSPSIAVPPTSTAEVAAPTVPPTESSADDPLDPGDDLIGPAGLVSPSAEPQTPVTPPVESQATEPLPAPSADDLLNDHGDLLTPPVSPPVSNPTQPMVPAYPLPTAPLPAGPPATSDDGAGASRSTGAKKADNDTTRCEFVARSLYPSASECRACHEKIYDEWSISNHAYAFVSPMFHKFEQTVNDITSGTMGYFCYRCHTPAGTSLGLSRAAPIWDAPLVAREGVTCVACHRVREMYGKTNGERRIEPGDIHAPVYGTIGGDGVAAVVAQKDQFKVHPTASEKGPGIEMHSAGFCFPQLAHSEFCTSCHQVAVYPGIKLEVVWEQYRASPACKKGIQCQDCHMGRIPGVPSGYEFGPAALINSKSINANRKHSNHAFYGPGYSIAHPGIFPINPKAERWSVQNWLLFDWRAGWGEDKFEDAVDDGKIHVNFPPQWKEADDRVDARKIIDDNLKKRDIKYRLRTQVMENGSHVDGPYFEGPQCVGQELRFNYVIVNTNEGHNLPTASLGAQPQVWANVVLIGPRGQRLWESGYLDSKGDLADIHSTDVREKRLTFDWQLFNLQTMFLITGAVGTDREFYLPVNVDIDPLPFIRPAGQPVSVLNHPPFIRMEARSLAPLGSRRVPYKVPGELLREPGRYRLSFRMRNRTEPMYFMRFCGSTVEMQRSMIEGTLDFHESSVEFDVR